MYSMALRRLESRLTESNAPGRVFSEIFETFRAGSQRSISS